MKKKMRNLFLVIFCLLIITSCNKRNDQFNPEPATSITETAPVKEVETVQEEITNDIDSQENISQGISVKEFIQRWSIPDTESELKIKDDGTYSFGHPMGDGPFAFGKWLIMDDKIELFYPETIYLDESNDNYKKHDLEVLFKDKESILLEYDGKYEDFNTTGCLRTDDLIITTFYGKESPANKVYVRNGIKVKKLPKYSFLISSDNMKLREKPSLNSTVMTFKHGWEYRNFPYDLIPDSKNVVWLKEDTNLLLKGYAVETICSTEEETEIDGISAPWYCILDAGGEEDFTHEFWIWGGYAKLYQGNSYRFEASNEDKSAFIKACIDQGIIRLE
ncbi:MAG: hypothetical protein J6Y16_01525 [Treponema sp.]|nr:hypothetical protein [Treponema sp.]